MRRWGDVKGRGVTARIVVTWLSILLLAVVAFAVVRAADDRRARSGVVAAGVVAGPTTPPVDSPSCVPSDTRTKAPLQGIVTIGSLPQDAIDAFVGGMSVNVPWADLQPSEAGPLVRPNAIDAAITAVRAAGLAGSCPRGVKLRVLAGTSAPGWAKRLGGDPVTMTLPQDGLAGEVPRFWTPQFGTAYAELHRLLAAAYDAVPEVREVVMSRCTTFYAEPLLRQATEGSNAENLDAAGLDEQQDRMCLAEQVEAHTVWRWTPSSLALNPYADLGGGIEPAGLDVTFDAADRCRAVLADRCILANNSVRWPMLSRRYADLYVAMEQLGAPLEFQTAAPKRVGNLVAAVSWAVERGADSVEIEPSTVPDARAGLAALAAEGWGPQ